MDAKLVIATKQEDIDKEARFKTLNDKGFVRGESAVYQWYLLVNEACTKSKMVVDEMVRDYLATMLYRFMGRTELLEQLAAFDFYRHILGMTEINSVCTQDIADMSLQYIAFFPERSYNRHEPRSLEQIANIGTSLYQELAKSAQGKDDWFSRAFQLMATSFGSAIIVLRSANPRFAHFEEQPRGGLSGDALYIPNAPETKELGRALERFGSLYFRSESSQGRKDN